MITLTDYITASGKYPERLKSSELTNEVKANAADLLDSINKLLDEVGVTSRRVSSGFRPSGVNAGIKGAAKRSLHMTGKAIDLSDPDGQIAKKVAARPDLMRKYGVFLESPAHTKGWCHLDKGSRSDRPNRQFIP